MVVIRVAERSQATRAAGRGRGVISSGAEVIRTSTGAER